MVNRRVTVGIILLFAAGLGVAIGSRLTDTVVAVITATICVAVVLAPMAFVVGYLLSRTRHRPIGGIRQRPFPQREPPTYGTGQPGPWVIMPPQYQYPQLYQPPFYGDELAQQFPAPREFNVIGDDGGDATT